MDAENGVTYAEVRRLCEARLRKAMENASMTGTRNTSAMSDDRRYLAVLDPITANHLSSAVSPLWSAYAWGWDEESGAFALRWVWSIEDQGQDANEVLHMLTSWADDYAGKF